jgi:hypothetical protein
MANYTVTTMRDVMLSVYYKVFMILRAQGWWIPVTGDTLSEVTSADDINVEDNTYGTIAAKPWVFLDDNDNVTTSLVTVYDKGSPLASGTYTVDYLHGRVSLDAAPSGAVTADYREYIARVIDAYPEDEYFEHVDLPVISVQLENQGGEPWAIGTSLRMYERSLSIDIFAATEPQRQDMADSIHRFMVALDLYSFVDGLQPLLATGDVNTAWSFVDNSRGRPSTPISITTNLLRPRRGHTTKSRFHSLTTLRVAKVS